jgi:hypothetical protein
MSDEKHMKWPGSGIPNPGSNAALDIGCKCAALEASGETPNA